MSDKTDHNHWWVAVRLIRERNELDRKLGPMSRDKAYEVADALAHQSNLDIYYIQAEEGEPS